MPSTRCNFKRTHYPNRAVLCLSGDIEHPSSSNQPPGNPALIALLRAEIAAGGPVPFRRFMELALYHPQHGYYASGRAAIGRHGDFFTNVSVGALFGKLLATQFAEMWERLGKPHEFSIVEQGAHNGDLARDVLAAARGDAPEFFDAIRYAIVEPFDPLRGRQQETLGALAGTKVSWHASLAELEPFTGVHFSNELLDALPVHPVVFLNGAWRERRVDFQNARFVFNDDAPPHDALRGRLEKIAPPRIEGYTTEVSLDALDWIDALAAKLARGFALAVDYGHARGVFYDASRTSGTLACYAKHRRGDDPLQAVGEADITAHVEFTSLAERAESRGLALAGFTDQHHFTVGLGARIFRDSDDDSAERRQQMRAFKTLMHPNLMGQAFKVLAFAKNVAPSGPLAGFQFGSDPRAALGLPLL